MAEKREFVVTLGETMTQRKTTATYTATVYPQTKIHITCCKISTLHHVKIKQHTSTVYKSKCLNVDSPQIIEVPLTEPIDHQSNVFV